MGRSLSESSLTEDIRKYYDLLSGVHQLLRGPRIHHGYWEDEEPAAEAQVKLIERLACRLDIAGDHRVLDIGSGLGGSACWLAKTFGCSVLGLTLSDVQAQAGAQRADDKGLSDRVSFKECDTNNPDVPAGTFDRVWVLEYSEHVHDKQSFFEQCARLLRPGGRLGLCGWLRGDSQGPEHAELVREICQAMLCPSLLTMAEQTAVLQRAGLGVIDADDITANVLPTWEHANRLLSNPLARMFLHTKGRKLRRFVEAFKLIERAYRDRAMAYAMITAAKA